MKANVTIKYSTIMQLCLNYLKGENVLIEEDDFKFSIGEEPNIDFKDGVFMVVVATSLLDQICSSLSVANSTSANLSIKTGNTSTISFGDVDTKEPFSYKQNTADKDAIVPTATIFNSESIEKKDWDSQGEKSVQLAINDPEDRFTSEIPEDFKEFKGEKFKDFVADLDRFHLELNKAKNKIWDGPEIDSIQDERKRAVALEQKEQFESIEPSAYVVNDSCASLYLSDLDLNLPLNVPVDLSRFSASKLSRSKDLTQFLKNGMISFVSPDDIPKYLNKHKNAVEVSGYDVGSVAEIEENMFNNSSRHHAAAALDEASEYDLSDFDDEETDTEKIMRATRSEAPAEGAPSNRQFGNRKQNRNRRVTASNSAGGNAKVLSGKVKSVKRSG